MPFTVLDPATAEAAPTTDAGQPLSNTGMTLESMLEDLSSDMQGIDVSDRGPDWINRAYKNLAGMLDINELQASVSINLLADQPFYLVPETLAWVEWFGNEDSTDYRDGGRGFEMIDRQTYRMLPDSDAFTVTQLLPYKWFRFARMIVLWPTPETATTAAMDFRVRPASLVDLDDSPILPEDFHEPLYQMALARGQRARGFRSEGDRAYNDALSYLRPLLNTDAEEMDSMNMTMQPIRARSQLYRRSR